MGWESLFNTSDLFGSSQPVNSAMSYTPPLAEASPTGGGGWWSDLASTVSQGAKDFAGGIKNFTSPFAEIAKAALPIAQIGTGIMGGISGAKAASAAADQAKMGRQLARTQQQATEQAAAAARPLTDFGVRRLAAAEAGQLGEAEQAQIDEWVRGAKQQAADYMARAGIGDSESMTSWNNWIDRQAVAMRNQALQAGTTTGVNALNAGANAAAGAANAAGYAGQTAGAAGGQIEQLIAQANQQLARLSAGAS